MNIQVYRKKKKHEAFKYVGRCGLHIYATSICRRLVNPFVFILPLLALDWKWIYQGCGIDRRYYSINFGWIVWSGAFYFRSRKLRLHREDI